MSEEYKCKKCNKEFENYDGLRRHMGRIHKINAGNFYCEFYLNGDWPVCKCGCGGKVKWYHGNFREYSKGGHISRIENHWGHNQKAIDKSSETRRRQFATGERQVWCKGLTTDTDERVKKLGENVSKAFTDERKEKMSVLLRENRKNGITPTLYGPQSSQWKGGISEVNNIARSDKRLYDEWKYPILVRDGFKCVECGNNENLHIHHNKETMSEIVRKHVVDKGIVMNFELKKSIAEKIVDYHIKNKVSGITLCDKCHNKLHPSLNFT
jgi:hypothetical protein